MDNITLDFTDVMATSVDGHGVSEKELEAIKGKAGRAHRKMELDDPCFRRLPQQDISEIVEYGEHIKEKFDNFLLLGIGGSALGPKALFKSTCHTFYNGLPKEDRRGPKCYFEDNVDPERMHDLLEVMDLKTTCINIVSKSGKTIETLSQFLILMERLQEACPDDWQEHLVITTDAKKGFFCKFAKEHKIKTFHIPEDVGGRFSIFTPVGILTGVVCGCDIEKVLLGAKDMNEICTEPELCKNPAYLYAAMQYLLMRKGKNVCVMMPYAECLKFVTDWFSQLWAESLGKQFNMSGNEVHVGQTPVRALGSVDQHSQVQLYVEGPFDKVITFIRVNQFKHHMEIPKIMQDNPELSFLGGSSLNKLINSELQAISYTLTQKNRPNIVINMPTTDEYYLGQLFMMLEIATAYSGYLQNINPFDQPGVEDGKISTYALMGKQGFKQRRRELEIKEQERFQV